MLEKTRKLFLRKKNIPILAILIIAAFMRLYHISEYMTFLGDEGRDVLVAFHILHGNLTLLGPTASVGGFFLGPIYYYMMVPFLFLFNYDPVGPAVMVALFGVATVWLVYKVADEFFGVIPAVIASLLYALSPLVIIYSRSSWNPNTVPFFSLLMLYLLYLGVIRKSWKKILISGILFGILLQLHYLATFLGVAVFLFLLIASFYQLKNIGKGIIVLLTRYVYFALGTVIGWSPFLAFEVRHGFPNLQSIFKFVFTSGETGNNDKYLSTVQDVFARVFGRLLLSFPQTSDLHLFNSGVLQVWGTTAVIIGIFAIGLSVAFLIHSSKETKNSFYQHLMLLIWILTGVFLFGFYKKPIYDYYFGILFPVPFLLFGSLVSFTLKLGRASYGIIAIAVIAMAGLAIYFTPIKTPGNNQLKQVRDISNFVLSKTGGKPFNFAVISSGGNSDFAYRYFFEVADRPPVTIQYPGADPERKTITSQLLIVCESVPCQPLGYPLWEVAGFGQADIAGSWPVSVVRVYRLVHYKGK